MEEGKVVLESAFLYLDEVMTLGEGAIWDHRTREFYWVDIERGMLFTFDPLLEQMRVILLGQRVGTVVPSSSEGVAVVALQDGIYTVDVEGEQLQKLADAPYDPTKIRFNDGKCDPAGRLWVGTMGLDERPGVAALYRYSRSGEMKQMLPGLTISNGICWSLDGKTMYHIDTHLRTIKAFDYDNTTGNIVNGRQVIVIDEKDYSPDGMTIDSEGKLWVALWGGASVIRIDPDTGQLLSRIAVPAKNVTSCAFGGPNLNTLLITTASIGMTAEEKAMYPKAGAVFAAIPGVKGVEAHVFKE